MGYALTTDRLDTVLAYWRQLADYLWMHNHYPEFIACCGYALAAAERLAATTAADGTNVVARAAGQLAFAHLELGEYDRAAAYLDLAEDR